MIMLRAPRVPFTGGYRVLWRRRRLARLLARLRPDVLEVSDRTTLRQQMPDAIFLGERRGEELAATYASLDVFVHSGPYETFGQTLQEAAASGLPVVAPAAGGPLDLVADGVTGYLVPPSDPDAFTTAVAWLAADPAARAAFGAAGRRKVLSRSWPALTEELIGHYAAVLGASKRAESAQVAI